MHGGGCGGAYAVEAEQGTTVGENPQEVRLLVAIEIHVGSEESGAAKDAFGEELWVGLAVRVSGRRVFTRDLESVQVLLGDFEEVSDAVVAFAPGDGGGAEAAGYGADGVLHSGGGQELGFPVVHGGGIYH